MQNPNPIKKQRDKLKKDRSVSIKILYSKGTIFMKPIVLSRNIVDIIIFNVHIFNI